MKKMIYLITAVIVALAFNACSANDNPTTPDNLSGRAVITVNKVAMYEEADMVELMDSYLSKFISITDTVLVYNQNGHLVKKVGTETKNLEPVTIVADDLPNGTYTFVLWQTGYSSDGAMKIPYMLADEEELATVKLVPIRNILIYANANGFASTTVTINGNSVEASVTPELVGRFFNLKSEKACNEYSFDQLVVYRRDQACRGIYLDPSRSGDDRWITEPIGNTNPLLGYLDKDITEFLFYTIEQGNDMELSVSTWTLVGDDWESYMIVYPGHHKLQDGRRLVYYLDVDRVSYQPPFFGLEDQLPAWKADRDAGILVNDPYIKWGGNNAEVEAHKQTKQYWFGGSDQPEFWEGFGWYDSYNIANDYTEYYVFETADGQNLTAVYCIYWRDNLSVDVFNKSLLLQGYTYLGKLQNPNTGDYYDIFLSADEKTEVLSYGDTESRSLLYYPFDPEDLNYVVPASLAPASSKVPSIVPNLRRSSLHSALMRDDYIKPSRQMRPVEALSPR